MTSEGLGEMFEGNSAHTCTGEFSLMLMGGQAEGLTCADPGARTPIGMSGNLKYNLGDLFRFPTKVVQHITTFSNLFP